MPKHQNPELIKVISEPKNGMRQAEYTISAQWQKYNVLNVGSGNLQALIAMISAMILKTENQYAKHVQVNA